MFEKMITFIIDNLKFSFVIGSVGSLLTYMADRLSNKKRTGVWGFNLIVAIVQLFIGGVVGYFVGTVLPLGSQHRDMLIGISGASSFPIFRFLENYGSDILNKFADKIKDKI